MATWIAHIRIAEHFMNKYDELNNTTFLVGNFGPDCGVPNEDWSKFTPDGHMTHWKTDGKTINAEGFKEAHMQVKDEKYPFYLGYYFHLLTDIEWNKWFERKRKEPVCAEGLETDKKFIWTIKKDWYGQDRLYLQGHRDSVFFTKFVKIDDFPNKYLEYYPDNAFTRQVKYISSWYMEGFESENPDREFPFLSKAEMDNFVESTILILEEMYSAFL